MDKPALAAGVGSVCFLQHLKIISRAKHRISCLRAAGLSPMDKPSLAAGIASVCFLQHLKLQDTKLPVGLVYITNERRLVQGHETPLRVKGDFEAVSSELDNGGLKVALLGGYVHNIALSEKGT
ncbi:hypothetical protein TNCV_1692901 [Trichonephila clavipes]|nr:hypothetical protein TNCV_1692901 [Trichonephila clavipes]